MKPWKILARAAAPGGGAFVLSQRDEELVIHVDGAWLMSSRSHGSEEEMAVAAGLAPSRGALSVLVGGLGFGYTLAAALARLAPEARVSVVELCAAVIEWNRGPAAHLAGRALEDPRVTVVAGDVLATLAKAERAFDAVLLDVDNGPWALAASGNKALYERRGLAAIWRALRPDGVLVVWSAGPSPRFLERLSETGFAAPRAVEVAARTRGRGSRHTLFSAVRPGTGPAAEAPRLRAAREAGGRQPAGLTPRRRS